MDLNSIYDNFFIREDPHSIERVQAMSTDRLFSELDDVVQILSAESNLEWATNECKPKRAYLRIVNELKNRVE